MSKKKLVRLSSGELQIMSMLWDLGPLTLAEAHQQFSRFGRPIQYPTMQTRLNRMVVKKVVNRSSDRPARYRAAVSTDQVAAGHLSQLLQAIGRTSVVPLMLHLVAEHSLTAEEIQELRKLLAEAEAANKGSGPRKD